MSETNFDLQVSPPIPCEVDYTLSEEQLDEYLDTQFQLIEEGKREPATMELAMLGYALDFMDFARNTANMIAGRDLDLKEENMELFDAILEGIHQMFAKTPPTQEDFDDMVKKATGYFGVVILKHLGGNWIQSNVGMGVNVKGTNAFLYNRIARRLMNGSEDEVVSFYEAIKNI